MSEHRDRFGQMDVAVAFNKQQEEKRAAAAIKAAEEKYMMEQGGKNLGEAIGAEAKYQLVLEAIRDGRIDYGTARRAEQRLRDLQTSIEELTKGHPWYNANRINKAAEQGILELNQIIAEFELAELTDDEVQTVIVDRFRDLFEREPWENVREFRNKFEPIEQYARQELHLKDEQISRVMSLLEKNWMPDAWQTAA